MRNFSIILITALLFLAVACRKENQSIPSCDTLRTGIMENDKSRVKLAIEATLSKLPSKQHTEENLEILTARIRESCGVDAGVYCYGCIQTLPEMSEIFVKFVVDQVQYYGVIDISHDQNNRMIFVNLHD